MLLLKTCLFDNLWDTRNTIDWNEDQRQRQYRFLLLHHTVTLIAITKSNMVFASMVPRAALVAHTKKFAGTTMVRSLCKYPRDTFIVFSGSVSVNIVLICSRGFFSKKLHRNPGLACDDIVTCKLAPEVRLPNYIVAAIIPLTPSILLSQYNTLHNDLHLKSSFGRSSRHPRIHQAGRSNLGLS